VWTEESPWKIEAVPKSIRVWTGVMWLLIRYTVEGCCEQGRLLNEALGSVKDRTFPDCLSSYNEVSSGVWFRGTVLFSYCMYHTKECSELHKSVIWISISIIISLTYTMAYLDFYEMLSWR